MLIRTGVREPSLNRDIPNNNMSRRLLGTMAKIRAIWSCMTGVGAQLAMDMLLSRPLGSPYAAPVLLPGGWSIVGSRRTLCSFSSLPPSTHKHVPSVVFTHSQSIAAPLQAFPLFLWHLIST